MYETLAALGHEVHTCDLQPALHLGNHHQGNVFDVLKQNWDFVLSCPPCTYLTKAQMHMLHKSAQRKMQAFDALADVKKIYNCGANQIVIENPPGLLNSYWQKPNQIIRPSFFGDPYHKELCLWTKNVAPLLISYRTHKTKSLDNHINSRMTNLERSNIRSSWDWFPYMVAAMAAQWFTPKPP